MAGPVVAGLAGTVLPLIGTDAIERLIDWPGLGGAIRLSLVTGVVSTVLAVAVSLAIVAALHGGRRFGLLMHALSPLLALPHAAAALGLAFLIAPSGWIARLLSPWATGWSTPPDLLILNDTAGIALTLGLVVKEIPFLLLMLLAALPQADAARRMMLTQSLGYGRVWGWLLAVLPAVWPQLRLPVYAVLGYATTAVDMGVILGPSLPPPLSVQVTAWMMHPDLSWRGPAAAGALLQLALVATVLVLARLAERPIARIGRHWAESGRRCQTVDRLIAPGATTSALIIVFLVGGGMIGMGLWSVAGLWPFPQALPSPLSLATWMRTAPSLTATGGTTLLIALISTGAALALCLGCLEAEARFRLAPGTAAMWLLYLPLIVPQTAFLPGLQVLFLSIGAADTLLAVAATHLVFVLPYIFLSLAPPWRAWDGRIALAAAALGASETRTFWQLRLPMLLRPVLTAAAVGLAVSVGQYLPTLLVGGGRITTLTSEAVALSSGGNRRIIGAYAVLQMLLPAAGFLLALAIPALVFRNRQGMRAT
ncbi:ABC transporter permease subunit [Tabrizicola sp. J26]|uniref:ABC transporter permease n=1 Tax=Alitabrizicola rongguiensis TaxID=2909234 RepID=UPI001F425921|nr:ABC transporter permease subunit [Tabrizicola rongguiensis]MCF1710924.1 ABC transporter permease subunit [Tabrizicola rongguiensis]